MTKAEKVAKLKEAAGMFRENREACAEAFPKDQAYREIAQKMAAKVFEDSVAGIFA